jgi:hypothetical protein
MEILTGLFIVGLYKATEKIWEKGFDAAWEPVGLALVEYQAHRRRLQAAEAPRQFLRRLHHDPVSTMQRLMDRYAARRAELTCGASTSGNVDSIHTS